MPRRNSILDSFRSGARNALTWQLDPTRIIGAGENALSGATAFGTSVVAGPVAAYHAMRSGSTREYGPMYNAIMERGTYQPRTASGQALQNALSGIGSGYSEAIRRDVQAIPVDRPIARTAARIAGEFAPAVLPGISPAVRAIDAMPPTSARMRQAGIVNYHGTPHTVDRFSTDRIGTGEGAQAYGHGLYFADDAAVAQQYADALSTSRTTIDGVPVTPANPDFSAIMSIAARGYKQALADAKAQLAGGFVDPEYQSRQIAAIERIGPKARIKQEKVANVYTVDIPDEHIARMLDWDKPLSEQPPEVQALVQQMADDSRSLLSGRFSEAEVAREVSRQMKEKTGWDLYNWASNKFGGDAQASAALRDMGIPGIRYFDGASRGAGQGTRNTVLFDDSLVNITHENGQPRRRPGQ